MKTVPLKPSEATKHFEKLFEEALGSVRRSGAVSFAYVIEHTDRSIGTGFNVSHRGDRYRLLGALDVLRGRLASWDREG